MKRTKASISARAWSYVGSTFPSSGTSFSQRMSIMDAPRKRCRNARNSPNTAAVSMTPRDSGEAERHSGMIPNIIGA